MRVAAESDAAAVPEVGARIALVAGHVHLRLRVGSCETLDFDSSDFDESMTIDELRAKALEGVRPSALAAGRARRSAEQTLNQAIADAEADEAWRRESWRLAQKLR